jgi:hypothetical protein
MQAAERIFEGQFDSIQEEDEDVQMDSVSLSDRTDLKRRQRLAVCLLHPNIRYIYLLSRF